MTPFNCLISETPITSDRPLGVSTFHPQNWSATARRHNSDGSSIVVSLFAIVTLEPATHGRHFVVYIAHPLAICKTFYPPESCADRIEFL